MIVLKLNKFLGRLCNPSSYVGLLYGLLYCFFQDSFFMKLGVEIAVFLIFFFLYSPELTKNLKLMGNEIHYKTRVGLPITGFSTRPGLRIAPSVKVNYFVRNISKLEIRQNFFERLFGFAHIVFIGTTEIEAKKHADKLSPPQKHCIYGVVLKKHGDTLRSFMVNCGLSNEVAISTQEK